MVFSGTKVFVDDVDLLMESKSTNSLLLANHGSRIDWMVAMIVGNLKHLEERPSRACRVGFVCEALIQLMPFVGWYRKIICHDIFVSRSFLSDQEKIKKNLMDFQAASEQRMLFLSPEGVIVDNGEQDMKYIHNCRNFAAASGFKPFDYVLTPRYKGTNCLLQQVVGGGPVVSICLAFVRKGKLLNCKLLSPDRVVPDIYDLCQGIAGAPVDIYIHLRRINVNASANANVDPTAGFDAKTVLMNDYVWKDSVLAAWEKRLSNNNNKSNDNGNENDNDGKWMEQFTPVEASKRDVLMSHLTHGFLMTGAAVAFGRFSLLLQMFAWIFCCISITHTIGWFFVNKTSMESVPFETGIKAAVSYYLGLRAKVSSGKKRV